MGNKMVSYQKKGVIPKEMYHTKRRVSYQKKDIIPKEGWDERSMGNNMVSYQKKGIMPKKDGLKEVLAKMAKKKEGCGHLWPILLLV